MITSNFIDNLKNELLDNYQRCGILNFYKSGDYLLKNGTPVFGLMYIYSGLIELIAKNEEGFLIRKYLKSGDILNEDLNLQFYPFDARAAKDSQIFFIDKYFIGNLLNISKGKIA